MFECIELWGNTVTEDGFLRYAPEIRLYDDPQVSL
jgi:hypothetical protein